MADFVKEGNYFARDLEKEVVGSEQSGDEDPLTFDEDPIEKLLDLPQPGSDIPVLIIQAPERPRAEF